MNAKYAQYLIKKTKEDFDKIAESFSESRSQLWPELKELKKHIKDGKRVLDLGCGNGRLFSVFGGSAFGGEYVGVDASPKLIEKAREKYGNGDRFKVANILELPFADNHFGSIWAVAVFHHIPSVKLRLKALEEMRRVLKKDGKIIMTCWNLYQSRYLMILLKFTFRKLLGLSSPRIPGVVRGKLDFKDVFIPWKGTRVQRYYHAFTECELKKLFQKARFRVEELKYLKRSGKKVNILIIGIK